MMNCHVVLTVHSQVRKCSEVWMVFPLLRCKFDSDFLLIEVFQVFIFWKLANHKNDNVAAVDLFNCTYVDADFKYEK